MLDARRPLTPIKETALRCMARGPVAGAWGRGWLSSCGRHEFNTHTVSWLVSAGYAVFSPARTDTRITGAGRGILLRMDDAA